MIGVSILPIIPGTLDGMSLGAGIVLGAGVHPGITVTVLGAGAGVIIPGTIAHGAGAGAAPIGIGVIVPIGAGVIGTMLPIVITTPAMRTMALVLDSVNVPDWQPTVTTVAVWMQWAPTATTLVHAALAATVAQA